MTEQAMTNRQGIEYTVITETGLTTTIVQELASGERIFEPGARVIIQNSGEYQRVLAADYLPEQMARPKGIKLIDE
jgi:outer membrane lipoprotein SlyB